MIKNKYLMYIILSTIILISGCITEDTSNEQPKITFKYLVEIQPNGYGNYSLVIPIPFNDDNFTNEILENIQIIEGEVNYNLIHTEKGIALNILGNGKVFIESKGETWPFPYFFMSMRNQTSDSGYQIKGSYEDTYWVYSNFSTNISQIDLKIFSEANGISGYTKSMINDTVAKKGWLLLEGNEIHKEY